MSTHDVRIRPVDNKVLSNALKEINTIMKEFDVKMSNVYYMLEEEMKKIGDEDETSNAIDEIMARIMDDLPDRICFVNELYSIASNAPEDEEEEEDDEEEDEEED